MWTSIKEIVEFSYHISGVLLVAGVGVGLYQLRIMKKDLKDKNIRAATEKSLEYLGIYASVIIRDYNEYMVLLKEEIPKRTDTSYLFDGNFNLSTNDLTKEILVEAIVAQKCGMQDILNQLEHFSVAMLHGVADESIVYTPASRLFCRLVEEEHIIISLNRNQGTPYANLLKLYTLWKGRMDLEKYQLQKREAENNIKEKGVKFNAKPPIGF